MDLSTALTLLASGGSAISRIPQAAARKQLMRDVISYLKKEWRVKDLDQVPVIDRDQVLVNTVMKTVAISIRDCQDITDAVCKHCHDLCLCILYQIVEEEGSFGVRKYVRGISTLLGINEGASIYQLSRQLVDSGEFNDLRQIARGHSMPADVVSGLKRQMRRVAALWE